MRTWIAILASSLALASLPFVGCSSDVNNQANASSGNTGLGGNGGVQTGCNGNQPDGFCNVFGQDPETCQCADCADSAFCGGKCNDADGKCTLDQGEDCTCKDCYFKVAECPPYKVGCGDKPDGKCDADEDCTCGDCTNTDRCTKNCNDNGSCVPYLEGCSCADCKPEKACGGNGSTSSSSSTAASSTAASSTAASTGAGGAGGAGAGGAGGAAGAGG
jgi:hypothetical protein